MLIKYPCSTRDLGPLHPFFCLHSLQNMEAWQAHFLAQAFKTFLRGCPVPSRVVQVLYMGFTGFPCNQRDTVSLSFSLFLLVDCSPQGLVCKRPLHHAILLFTALDFTSMISHIHNWVLFSLWLHPFILSGVISRLFSGKILGTYQPGEFIFHCPIFFAFSYCSWGSQGKNTKVVCLSLLQWTTFCQNSPPWPISLG